MTPPLPTTPHLLDLSPSDHLSDHKALPLPGQKTEDSHSQADDFPDRSTYQTLPDTPGTPPVQDPLATAGGGGSGSQENLIPAEATPETTTAATKEEEEEEFSYDLSQIRAQYRRSGGVPGPGLVKRDIGVVRRHTHGGTRNPAPPKPLSPVLSLVGGDIKREKGEYGAYSVVVVGGVFAAVFAAVPGVVPAAAPAIVPAAVLGRQADPCIVLCKYKTIFQMLLDAFLFFPFG
jgi:hypothetical protein